MNIIFIIRRQKVLKNQFLKYIYDCCKNIIKQTYLANCLHIECYKFVNKLKYLKNKFVKRVC